MKIFSPVNLLFPFLTHALRNLVGAFLAAKIVGGHKMSTAIGIGVFYLLGGFTPVYLLGGPLRFKVLDLVFAYIPMGWLGGELGGGMQQQTAKA